MSLLGAAAITAGAGILGNIIGAGSQNSANNTNMRINQMNNEFNERMLDKQLAFQTDMFNKTNEYNSASSQVQRYREAGLNPYLMMQNGSAGVAQSQSGGTASASGAPAMQAFRPDMSAFEQVGQMLYQQRMQDAQIANLVQDTTSKEIANRTAYQEAMARLRESYERTSSSKLKRHIDYEMLQLQRRQMNADFDKTIQEQRNLELQAQGTKLDNVAKALQNAQLPTVLKLNVAQALANLEQTKLQNKHIVQQTLETQARQLGIRMDNDIKSRTADAVVERAKQPQNMYQLGYDGVKGIWDKAIVPLGNAIDKHFIKPSKKSWKDTKRAFGLYW